MAKDLLIISEAIEKFLDERKYTPLRDVLKTMQAADIAALFEILPRRKLSLLFRLLPKEQAAEAFVEMDLDLQEHLIHGFSDNELKEIVDELYLDDTVDMVEELPANVVKRILAQANPETRQLINEMLQYPEDSAGGVMTTEYVDLSADMTVPDAIKHIKRTGVDKETINVCYVTSSFQGVVDPVGLVRVGIQSVQRVDEQLGGQLLFFFSLFDQFRQLLLQQCFLDLLLRGLTCSGSRQCLLVPFCHSFTLHIVFYPAAGLAAPGAPPGCADWLFRIPPG